MKQYFLHTALALLLINNISPINALIPRIIAQEFQSLILYAKQYLASNKESLELLINESGSARINIPIIEKGFKNILKLRLNFWSDDSQILLLSESIHSHPLYFESYLINGGYTHELFIPKENGHEYSSYTIEKNYAGLKIIDARKINLAHSHTEDIDKGQIVAFDTNLIHRITHYKPQTLSMNIVFKDDENQPLIYNVFRKENKDEKEINLAKRTISGTRKELLIDNILNLLAKSA